VPGPAPAVLRGPPAPERLAQDAHGTGGRRERLGGRRLGRVEGGVGRELVDEPEGEDAVAERVLHLRHERDVAVGKSRSEQRPQRPREVEGSVELAAEHPFDIGGIDRVDDAHVPVEVRLGGDPRRGRHAEGHGTHPHPQRRPARDHVTHESEHGLTV